MGVISTRLTWWRCKYCSAFTTGGILQCRFCASWVIDCGDFALRVVPAWE